MEIAWSPKPWYGGSIPPGLANLRHLTDLQRAMMKDGFGGEKLCKKLRLRITGAVSGWALNICVVKPDGSGNSLEN